MPDQLIEKPEKKAVELHYQRARRSWRSRFAADYRHWVRRTFSRESYVSSLKALLWVLPLSALIWSYAFNEQLDQTNTITVNLALAQDADRVVRFAQEQQHSVQAKLEGPRKDVAAIEDYLRANTLKLDVDRSQGDGRHQIDVFSALNHDRRVTLAGMTVKLCEPQEVFVDVDTIVPRLVDVKLRPDEPASIRATFTPAKVKLLGPKRDLDAAAPSVIYASPKSYTPYLKRTGVSSVPAIALEIPPGLDATTSPSTVSAEIEVTGDEDSFVLDAITVQKVTPGGDSADLYKVVFDPKITLVKIAGPKEAIEGIRSGDKEMPFAEFDVVFDNSPEHEAQLRYEHLPPGVRVVEDKPRTIKYRLQPR